MSFGLSDDFNCIFYMIMYTCIWSRLHSWGHNGFHWHVSAGLLHRKLPVSSNWESLKLPLGYCYMIRWFLSNILHFIDCPVRCNNRHQSCVHLRSTGVNNAFCQCVGFEHRALFVFEEKVTPRRLLGLNLLVKLWIWRVHRVPVLVHTLI